MLAIRKHYPNIYLIFIKFTLQNPATQKHFSMKKGHYMPKILSGAAWVTFIVKSEISEHLSEDPPYPPLSPRKQGESKQGA